ncbi:MAG TPA: PD-(D/E)XK nuclease family transposase [Leptospiraceae bacterium]|nr:PD-(D/E)XK nuclease family transposase [Leptospiraceae bacterium]HNF14941.1 PD-(D/E)XK nuclease family transposase [Leptospiraceae bacterium]HNF26517.1 PD-(D/E)XK nuclease family transposase [Leptospiraceae bacterium]HNI28471.1 PD-(D/E)XK nuclease family transposase [Leptospiraceae bacterium]HNI99628.1 PD-(D/E)XK nuclease family transposase [Leptospiraceae bacterium]
MKFADPKNDIAFRKIFGNETKKIILISFLNSVLNLEDDKNTISSSTGLSLEEIENLQI